MDGCVARSDCATGWRTVSNRIPSPYAGTVFAPVARASDPPTSHAAAKRIEPTRGSKQALVLSLIRAYKQDGLTAQQVERYLRGKDPETGKPIEGFWKRVSDLKTAGLVVGTGRVRDGGEVYVATEFAL